MNAATATPPVGVLSRAKGWAAIARVPFLSVGILPYVLGARIATFHGATVEPWVFWLGLAGVVLIMLATYFNGEYADVTEDTVSTGLGRSQFAGGSGAVVDGLLPRDYPRYAGYAAAGLALAIGLVLTFAFRTGPWTLPIGIFGLAAGYYYSMPPFRWVQRGVGELLIGICYGWLPVGIGYYLAAGSLPPILLWTSLPIAFTIFNVIYANEYPDFEGDQAAGKRNLLQRVGRERGVWIYVAAVIAAHVSYVWALAQGMPSAAWQFYAAVAALSLIPAGMLVAGLWRTRKLLEPICGMTIVVNLATTAVFIAAFWPKG